MDDDQQFCLRWNNHQSTLISVFDTLLENETLVDCTLAAEGRFMKAHKVVLSACSPYFATLLQQQYDKHPIFILKDVKYQELRAMMDYMYRGEVNISQDQLAALLKAAESLQIKGLSDNRSGSGAGSAPRQEIPHQRASIPGGKHGYTLEQTKRARLGPGSGIEQQEIVSGSREGSSSPSRRRRKPRRRSIDNDVHDNSNSSANQQPNASLAGSAITASALASQMTVAAAAAAAASAVVSPAALASAVVSSQQQSGTQQQQAQLTTNVPKKTETIKGTTSDAMNNENIQATTSGTAIVGSGAAGVVIGSGAATVAGGDEQDNADKVEQKSNHKQKSSNIGKDASTIPSGELTIEPKSEYDDEGNDENVEDLTLDEEEMGMDDLDHNAGTSQGGEGSSQGYAAWQHDNRSQDELLLTTQDAQQRDPQAKHDKSEQTDSTPEEFELDDCLLESNDIVITQNKDGFILHVKKLGGNMTTAKLPSPADEEHTQQSNVSITPISTGPTHSLSGGAQITEIAEESDDIKPQLTTLTTSSHHHQTIKLPSTECELINIKKIIPASTAITAHHPHTTTTIIQPQQLQHHQQQQHLQQHQQPQQQQIHHHQIQQLQQEDHHIQHIQQHHQQQDHQQQQHTQIQQIQHQVVQHHPQVQSIVTTNRAGQQQTINLMSLRNVQITEQKPTVSRIKYTHGKIITPSGSNLQIVEAHDAVGQHQDISEGTKYEISEIDLNNPNTSAAIISDFVKYAEIDDIELPDGTKIGIGFAPADLAEHIPGATTTSTGTTATIHSITEEALEQHHQQQLQHQQQHQHLHIQASPQPQHQHIQVHHHGGVGVGEHLQTTTTTSHHHELQLHEHDDATTSVDAIIPDSISVHEQPSITKSYTILTSRPLKQEGGIMSSDGNTTTYELSLSDSSMGGGDDADSKYVCRHCGKKYRWKSTLRRHENFECGGKEPCHPCPHCSYKAKQRGNLGVHVRKHHPDKPRLESKRGRKI